MTTKDQERKALEKIRATLSTLDADGWVNIAFDGVCDQAEQNIDNDWACSYKQDADLKAQRLEDLSLQIRERDARIEKLRSDLAAAQAGIIPVKDLQSISSTLAAQISDNEAKLANAAAEIVAHADQPRSEDFGEAVRLHRRLKAILDELHRLRASLDTAAKAILSTR